jgi:hypothetical protein
VTSLCVCCKLFPVKAHSPTQRNLLGRQIDFIFTISYMFRPLFDHNQAICTEIYKEDLYSYYSMRFRFPVVQFNILYNNNNNNNNNN